MNRVLDALLTAMIIAAIIYVCIVMALGTVSLAHIMSSQNTMCLK
jgi:hypothetical protein